MLPILMAAAGAVGGFKIGQALVDEDYPGDTVPENVRQEMIQAHVKAHGSTCPRCERGRRDLQIDHKIPLACNGRNSRLNLQVLCAECNQKKGATYNFWEWLTGRTR